MKFCSIASGSSGNCIYAGTTTTGVLIDAGISGKKIEQGLNTFGQTGRDLKGILVTHEHIDHIKGLGVMARKLGIPIYLTEKTGKAIKKISSVGEIPNDLYRIICPDQRFAIGDMEFQPFSISHDAADPVGYRIETGGKCAAVATDLGIYDTYIVNHLRDLDILLLEANHDVRMLEVGIYPYYLKQRILGNRGHLSNEMAGQLLCQVLHDNIRQIFLGHLSKENNYPALAYETVCSEVTMSDSPWKANDFRIEVAGRDSVSHCVEI